MDSNSRENEIVDISEIYTPLSVAKEEIWRRWNDTALKRKVENFLGGDVPDFLKSKPKAIMVRYIASPWIEFFNFIDLAKLADLDVVLAEYSRDKFVARNPDKYNLCKMFFHDLSGEHEDGCVSKLSLIDFNKYEGKTFDNIKTIWGGGLIDFHHELINEVASEFSNSVVDISEWFDRNRDKERNEYYYVKYLSLFLCHGVLFENFLLNKYENGFTKNKVLPSFYKLEKKFGIKPLIVPIESFDEENQAHWWHYPQEIKEVAQKIIETKKRNGLQYS